MRPKRKPDACVISVRPDQLDNFNGYLVVFFLTAATAGFTPDGAGFVAGPAGLTGVEPAGVAGFTFSCVPGFTVTGVPGPGVADVVGAFSGSRTGVIGVDGFTNVFVETDAIHASTVGIVTSGF